MTETWCVVVGYENRKVTVTRRLYYFGKDITDLHIGAFNAACDHNIRGLATINGYQMENPQQMTEALYACSHGSSENVRRAGCSFLDWQLLSQLKNHFPYIQSVRVYDCPYFNYALLASLPEEEWTAEDGSDDGSAEDGSSNSDDDDNFGMGKVIPTPRAPTIQDKINALPFKVDFDISQPQPNVTAHLPIKSHGGAVWHEAFLPFPIVQMAFEQPGFVLSQPTMLRNVLFHLHRGSRSSPNDPKDPENLRIRMKQPGQSITLESLRAVLQDLDNGLSETDTVQQFLYALALRQHRPGHPLEMRWEQVLKHQIMSIVKCPVCRKQVPAAFFTQYALADAKKHDSGDGCCRCRGEAASAEYWHDLRDFIRELDRDDGYDDGMDEVPSDPLTGLALAPSIEGNAPRVESRPSQMLMHCHLNHNFIHAMMPRGSNHEFKKTLQRSYTYAAQCYPGHRRSYGDREEDKRHPRFRWWGLLRNSPDDVDAIALHHYREAALPTTYTTPYR
ncbi:hypothetical protein TI39_contig348g00001 [Zymoseptoria brevis]|uniref:Uncharacterized protein n=1 Tax=Zymoseptoria brevis TaxID=1047168 RepID=A0A0F4GR09_9PEZI|nr:hypothetical protein TI39_contig348g00001 [Zymoseptoria brevis]